jgi:hypothetical protein
MHDPLSPATRSNTPEAAVREFRSVLGAGGGVQGQAGGADPDILTQLRGLQRWADARGGLLDGNAWLRAAQKGGAEHFIYHDDQSERVIKLTFPGQYGLRMRQVVRSTGLPTTLGDVIGLKPATPLEYLDRLALHNTLFGQSVHFLGIVPHKGGLSFAISQVFLRGTKPEVRQIADFMAHHGFRKLRGENAYYRAEDSLAIFDAHARNYALVDGVPVPFDVIPQYVDGRFEALLAMWV